MGYSKQLLQSRFFDLRTPSSHTRFGHPDLANMQVCKYACKDLHEVNYINKIKVDDVVLVKNPAKPRPYWLLGRVLELNHGDDHKVRSVKVKRADGAVQVHSIKHLYPLELSLTHAHNPHKPMDDSEINEYDFEGFENPNDQMSHTDEKSDSNDQMSHTDEKSDTNDQISHTDENSDSNGRISFTGNNPDSNFTLK